jgi:uncharacterized protein (TIGR03905 family)
MSSIVNYTYDASGKGACCNRIIVSLEAGTIKRVQIIDGCDGNHRAIEKLVCGRPASEVVSLLKGTSCNGSPRGDTSCPDQLALALQAAMKAK